MFPVGVPLDRYRQEVVTRDQVRFERWASSSGAGLADYTAITMTLEATGGSAVVVTDVAVEVTRTAAPAGRRLYVRWEDGCGSGNDDDSDTLTVVRYERNLDASRADPAKLRAAGFPYAVTPGRPGILIVALYTIEYDCTASVTLNWVAGGRRGSTVIGADGVGSGRPFRVTSTKRAPTSSLDPRTGAFTRRPQEDWTARPPLRVS